MTVFACGACGTTLDRWTTTTVEGSGGGRVVMNSCPCGQGGTLVRFDEGTLDLGIRPEPGVRTLDLMEEGQPLGTEPLLYPCVLPWATSARRDALVAILFAVGIALTVWSAATLAAR